MFNIMRYYNFNEKIKFQKIFNKNYLKFVIL